ncbi:hypothetical protein [Thauera aromatica]|uniref:hypothetical protein n=1 Tax=Thauera aromatica TaxID=59405 RepID=UPI001FFDA77E|nr:hypothetical protein [Thauera aromatica]MCK2095659.1 hypothetical protein [Thauera aromatica]
MAGELHLKANSRGSWASVCSFAPDQIERVKDGCRLIVLAAGSAAVSFKIVDDRGDTLHVLNANPALIWQDRTT